MLRKRKWWTQKCRRIFKSCQYTMLLDKKMDTNFHQWKVIPLYLVHRYLGKNFVSF